MTLKTNRARAVAVLTAGLIAALAALVSPTIFIADPANFNAGATSGADWMRALDGNRSLAQFSIPGTHNSGALFEPIRGTAKCQNLSISAQLNAGVRFLDIRCRHQSDTFEIYHGPIYQKDSFANVVGYVTDFLRAHPSETVIMSVQQAPNARNNTRSFAATFTDIVSRDPAMWLLNSTIPTLNQARGKIVLLRRFDAATPLGIDASNWPDNSTFATDDLRVQDQYKVSDTSAKWKSIQALLNQTRTGAATPLTLNFCSGVKSGRFGIPNVPSVSGEINPHLAQFFARNPCGNFGCVIMDFANEKLCAAIYGSNASNCKNAARLQLSANSCNIVKSRGFDTRISSLNATFSDS